MVKLGSNVNPMESKKTKKIKKLLDSLYFDTKNATAFSGKNNIYKEAKRRIPTIQRKDINKWFSENLTFTLHKPLKYKFRRNKTIVKGIDEQWQSDLVDMRFHKSENDGFVYLLTCIDCFSKYAWAVPLKTKFADEINRGFLKILKEGRKPKFLQTDKGSEFINKKTQAMLKKYKIKFFTTNSEMKAAIVERWNRTLKSRMYKYLTSKSTNRYIDVLQNLVNGYNNTVHRSIKMRPINVKEEHQSFIRQNLYSKNQNEVRNYKYFIGDLVRISTTRRTFDKGYLPKWSYEIFVIYDRKVFSVPVYYIEDFHGEKIKGGFYEEEIQKVTNLKEHRIEKIIRTKKLKDGKKLYLVRWLGWDSSFDSWVENIKNISK